MTTIDQVRQFLNVERRQLVKTMIYQAGSEVVAALVRGDHPVSETKLAAVLGVPALALADEATIERVTGAPMGFAGPVGLKLRIAADPAVTRGANLVTGANQADMHLVNVNPSRDFRPDLVADIHQAVDGDPCPKCGQPLATVTGIELARLSKTGAKLSAAFEATYQTPSGAQKPFLMGSCRLNLSRLLVAVIEARHDQNGIVWPKSVAPYQADILLLNAKETAVREAAEKLYADLTAGGLDALLDDRDLRPGVKFKDADLIGTPVHIVVGNRFLEKGEVELKARDGSWAASLAPDVAEAKVRGLMSQ
jgi:prolyl-tRNA synthetase